MVIPDFVRLKDGVSCPCCGAPITGDRCEYCGRTFVDMACIKTGEPFLLKVMRPDGRIIVSEVLLKEVSVVHESSPMLWADNLPICSAVPSSELRIVLNMRG